MSHDEKGAGNGSLGEQVLEAMKKVQVTGKSSVTKGKSIKAAAEKPDDDISVGSVTEMFVARNRKKTGVVTETTAATDLDQQVAGNVDFAELTFKVGVVAAPVDAAALQAEAKQRSEQLFGSAAEYYFNDLIIKELQAIPKIELTSRGKELETRIAQKKQFDVRMSKQPQGVQQQFLVDLFIVRIDKAMPTSDQNVLAVFDEIVEMGRGRKAAKGESADVYFRDDKDVKHGIIHMKSQMPGREGQVSGADLRIFKSLKGMIYRLRQYKEQEQLRIAEALKAKINEIKAQAGGDVWKFSQAVPGVYVVSLEAKEANGKLKGMPGAAKLEIHSFSVKGDTKPRISLRILEGAGCLEPRWERHPKFGWNIAFWWYSDFASYHKRLKKAKEDGKGENTVAEFPNSIPEEMRGPVQSFLRKLNAAVLQAKEAVRYKRPENQETLETTEFSVPAEELVEAPEPEHAGVAA